MNVSFAVFLLGMSELQYFGNNKWNDCTVPFASRFVKEFSYPLGLPKGPATLKNGVYTRTFDGRNSVPTVVTVDVTREALPDGEARVEMGGSEASGGRRGGGGANALLNGRSSWSSRWSGVASCIQWANGQHTGAGC